MYGHIMDWIQLSDGYGIHDQIQGKDTRWQRHIHGQILVVRLIINLHKNWIIII